MKAYGYTISNSSTFGFSSLNKLMVDLLKNYTIGHLVDENCKVFNYNVKENELDSYLPNKEDKKTVIDKKEFYVIAFDTVKYSTMLIQKLIKSKMEEGF